ncbi:MAG: O-antigen ligase family protein [Candidatus Roizmanbacteria bacterium]|nr:O-antigen ligase family protein [Candidatus Roizmanbacteria bacterium]
MKKLFTWLDNNILKILLVGYIFFIPLFPKLPFQMIDYTYIAIRYEDFFVALVYFVFFIQLLRKKVSLNRTYLILFVLFWISTFISFILGFYVQHTIIIRNVGFLNALRRIEYMSIFFVFAASVKSRKDVVFYLRLILSTIVIVTLYGLGQKYLGWPAVQTMNPEYAKGYLLVLDSWARISSTFGGHYDLAAFLIFFMPLLLALTVKVNKWYYVVFLLALSNIALTASRVSYGAYVLSALPFLLYFRKWVLLLITIVATVGLTLLSNNLTQRINRTFQTKQIFIDKTTGTTTVPRRLQPDDLPIGDYIIDKNGADSRAVDVSTIDTNTKDAREVKLNLLDDIRNEAKKTGKVLTAEEENRLVNEAFANMKVVSAVIPDISVATRLQVEWPRAIRAFLKYPIFGKGPSSITEATDNDYLRWLGEFGFVGTALFLLILGKLFFTLFFAGLKHTTDRVILWGVLSGFFGLLINATMIDIFEASKVAFIFWMIMGMAIGYLSNSPSVGHAKTK